MARLRFSIAGQMALVLVLGIGLAALKHPSERAASLLFTLILASLLTSILGAMARRDREQMTWIGFAAFGWTYLLLSRWFLPWLTGDQLRPPVLPSEFLEDLHPYIGPSPPPRHMPTWTTSSWQSNGNPVRSRSKARSKRKESSALGSSFTSKRSLTARQTPDSESTLSLASTLNPCMRDPNRFTPLLTLQCVSFPPI